MRLIIGIDPDLEKSGVAIQGDELLLKLLTFAEAVELFQLNQDQIKKVVIEAGWLNRKSNLHGRHGQSKSAGERIAKNVGENHATGKKLVEMAKYYGLTVLEVRPTRSKLNADEFKKITGYQGRTNQEVRDAAMHIWGMT